MNKQDLVRTISVAFGTAAVTVATLWSNPINAGGDGEALPTEIARPKLVARQVEMTLAAFEGRIPAAGEKPAFELKAQNTADAAVQLSVSVVVNATSMRDLLSRVPRLPATFWQQDVTLNLSPKETKVVTLQTDKSLPTNSMIAVTLQEAGPSAGSHGLAHGTVMLNFSTTPAGQTPLLAASR